MAITYRDSGVDIEGGNSFVRRISPLVRATFSEGVITDIGGFGALFSAAFSGYKDPVLVSGTDGVGTKLQIARMMKKHDTIGIDAVAMCVNDIITSGARPLFFLDYISCGKLNEDVMVDIVRGISNGCTQAGCSLIGGETAEHPGVMPPDDYDIAGFAVGVVDREKIINGSGIRAGDRVIGLPSSGIHSNGYSLVRKLFFEIKNLTTESNVSGLTGPLGPALLEPTRIYAKAVNSLVDSGIPVKGIVHITGGGFYENIPRILPEGTAVTIEKNVLPVPPVFSVIQREGEITDREMFTTFNMGTGMMLFTDPSHTDAAVSALTESGEKPVIIGDVVPLEKDTVIIK